MHTWLNDDSAKAICRQRAKTHPYIAQRIEEARSKGRKVPRDEWLRWAHEYDAVRRIMAGLATCCDGAKSRDSHGFNKFDAPVGRDLAWQAEWDSKEFWQAVRIVRKYSRQSDPKLMAWVPTPKRFTS
ncbi:MAG: hypothetical protein JSS66_05635 [Armatimonadetes bacterium]|nr:hypothetical protein [Armatimonadota bacterium]